MVYNAGMKKIKIIIVLLVVILAVVYYYGGVRKNASIPPEKVFCVQDAKICPDGSSVGRIGPKCEFAECPLSPMSIVVSASTTAKLNQKVSIGGIFITPLKVETDSRCPSDATCVWAGEVKILVKFESEGGTQETTLTMDDGITFAGKRVFLDFVSPSPNSQKTIAGEDYRFTFMVSSGLPSQMPLLEQKAMSEVKDKLESSKASPLFVGTVISGKSSILFDFKKVDYDKAVALNKPILLYFYANWCPICKEETLNALYPAFAEFEGEGLVGFRVNYKDSHTDKDEVALAREFGVPYQHTKVLLKDGKMVLKSPESWDKARYLKELSALIK